MKIPLLLLACFALAAFAQTKPGDTANGQRLFEKDGCYQCHGHVGQGGVAGARLAQTKLTLIAFTAYVRHPASGGMPPFRAKVLTDQELADIYAYIKTFPEPKPVKDIPLLNQ
jgi:mono/diheme cytochrome c family protein